VSDELDMSGDESVPVVSELAPRVYSALHKAITEELVCAVHDISEGGLLVCAAEMCIGGRLGLELGMDSVDPVRSFFGETTGCFLVEVNPECVDTFVGMFAELPVQEVASVTTDPELKVKINECSLFSTALDPLVAAWGASQ